jgi:hypothetical protein
MRSGLIFNQRAHLHLLMEPTMHPTRPLPLLLLSTCAFFIAGCGAGAISAPPVSSPGAVLKGTLRGGQQPISGAHIYLLEAGTSGYGGASVSLLNPAITGSSDTIGGYVLTSSTGSFSISGDYQCDAGGQVYLYALGGNTGGGTNSAAGMMALPRHMPRVGHLHKHSAGNDE